MILELADIRIQTGKNAEFEAAIAHGVKTIIAQAQASKVGRSIAASKALTAMSCRFSGRP